MNARDEALCNEILASPHTLIAGTTGAGKSVLLNSVLYVALKRWIVFNAIDLKRVELRDYKRSCLCLGYASEPEEVMHLVRKVILVMEDRYERMSGKMSDEMPYLLVIDELADLVDNSDVIDSLVRIGRLGRAANVHLLCATQDPSRRTLKAQLVQNFTTTVALRCRSPIESRQIIGVKGAELLPTYGKGIMWNSTGLHDITVPKVDEGELLQMIDERRNVPE